MLLQLWAVWVSITWIDHTWWKTKIAISMLLLFRGLALHTATPAVELGHIPTCLWHHLKQRVLTCPLCVSHCFQLPACNNWIASAGALMSCKVGRLGRRTNTLSLGAWNSPARARQLVGAKCCLSSWTGSLPEQGAGSPKKSWIRAE